MTHEVRDLDDGLWIWRLSYPDWHEGAGWPEVVTSTCVESGGEVAVLDALAAPEDSEVWSRLDVLKEADRLVTERFCPAGVVIRYVERS